MSEQGPRPPETQVSDAELAALDSGELDQLSDRQLRARIVLDPTAAARLAALRAGVHLTDEQRAGLQRRLARHPELSDEDMEMSDEAADRIAAAIDAEVARGQPPQQD